MSDSTPDSTTIADQMEAPHHVREAAFHALVGHGMTPDRDLLRMIDLSPVRVVNGAAMVPAGFAEAVRQRRPHLFAEHKAAFDARKASSADADRRFAEIQRGFHADRAAAATARTLAALRAGR